MPSPSPTAAATPTLNYQRPGADPILFRDGSDLVARGGSDFSANCVCCGRPSAGRPIRLTCIKPAEVPETSSRGGIAEILFILLWALLMRLIGWLRGQTPKRKVIFGLCPSHRRRRLIFGLS